MYRVIAWKVKLQAIRGIRIARHLSQLDRQGMHITQHCIVQAGGVTKQIPCGAASAHAAAALSQAVDCSRRTPRTFRAVLLNSGEANVDKYVPAHGCVDQVTS